MSLEYAIMKNGATVASIQREFLTLGSRYALEVADPQDAPARPLRRPRHRLLRRGTQRLKPDRSKQGLAMGQSLFLRRPQPGKEEASIFRQSSQ